MSGKIGRNEPCSCGSGKKYKKCCFLKSCLKREALYDLAHNRLRILEAGIYERHLYPYLDKILKRANDDVSCAYQEFLLHNDSYIPQDKKLKQVFKDQFFMPWMLFSWLPCEHLESLSEFDADETIAMNYMMACGARLSQSEKRFFREMDVGYFSFYSVQEVALGKYLMVKDLLLEKTYQVLCDNPTKTTGVGDVVFASILTFEEKTIFVAIAPIVFSPDWQTKFLDIRLHFQSKNFGIPLDEDVLSDYFADDLRMVFFEAMKIYFTEPKKKLCNTDGEDYVCTKSFFKLEITPEEALNGLMPITLSDDPEDFLEDAVYDDAGQIVEIKTTWLVEGNAQHKEWETTVMGHITLEPGKLLLETNSVERSERGQKLIKKLLGGAVLLEKVTKDQVEDLIKALKASDEAEAEIETEDEGNEISPEMKAHVEKMAKSHWDDWFDKNIPALDNQTPKEAVKTKLGRERLEMLFLQYERSDESRKPDDPFRADIQYLREALGMVRVL